MKTFAFTGGKGGVGKSFTAANVAMAMAKLGKRVVLFDADLQLANVDVMLGIQAPTNLQSVVLGEATLREILFPGPCGILIATGGSAVQGLMNAGPKRMGTFLSQIDDLAAIADYVIFDTGSGIDNRVMTFLKLANEVVIVSNADPTSVTDAYATIKTLVKKAPESMVSVLANSVTSREESLRIHASINAICKQFLKREVRFLGSVQHDVEALNSVRTRRPLMQYAPFSNAGKDISKIATELMQGEKIHFKLPQAA